MRKQQGKIKNPKLANKYRRKLSLRSKLSGTSERPRITTNKTSKHLRVMVIDDLTHKVLFSVQTFGKEAGGEIKKNLDGAKKIGEIVAGKLKDQNIERAVYDRNGCKFNGLVAVVANSIRENGIQI
jgi:large subunit ribosomal protein L18